MNIKTKYANRKSEYDIAKQAHEAAELKYKKWIEEKTRARFDLMVKVARKANRKKSEIDAYPANAPWLGLKSVSFLRIKEFREDSVIVAYEYTDEKHRLASDQFNFPLFWLSMSDWDMAASIRKACVAHRKVLAAQLAQEEEKAAKAKLAKAKRELARARKEANEFAIIVSNLEESVA